MLRARGDMEARLRAWRAKTAPTNVEEAEDAYRCCSAGPQRTEVAKAWLRLCASASEAKRAYEAAGGDRAFRLDALNRWSGLALAEAEKARTVGDARDTFMNSVPDSVAWDLAYKKWLNYCRSFPVAEGIYDVIWDLIGQAGREEPSSQRDQYLLKLEEMRSRAEVKLIGLCRNPEDAYKLLPKLHPTLKDDADARLCYLSLESVQNATTVSQILEAVCYAPEDSQAVASATIRLDTILVPQVEDAGTIQELESLEIDSLAKKATALWREKMDRAILDACETATVPELIELVYKTNDVNLETAILEKAVSICKTASEAAKVWGLAKNYPRALEAIEEVLDKLLTDAGC